LGTITGCFFIVSFIKDSAAWMLGLAFVVCYPVAVAGFKLTIP
jgi:hypothetical protein